MTECCCISLGNCSTTSYKVPKTYFKKIISRLKSKLPDDPEWCGSHQSYFRQVTCISCHERKPRRDLRLSLPHIPTSYVGEKICTNCITDSVLPHTPKKSVKRKLENILKEIIDEKYSIIPVEARFYNQIISGEKSHKWFSTKVGTEYLGKIVLMRAKTPDTACRLIIGAVILGPLILRLNDQKVNLCCMSCVFFCS